MRRRCRPVRVSHPCRGPDHLARERRQPRPVLGIESGQERIRIDIERVQAAGMGRILPGRRTERDERSVDIEKQQRTLRRTSHAGTIAADRNRDRTVRRAGPLAGRSSATIVDNTVAGPRRLATDGIGFAAGAVGHVTRSTVSMALQDGSRTVRDDRTGGGFGASRWSPLRPTPSGGTELFAGCRTACRDTRGVAG